MKNKENIKKENQELFIKSFKYIFSYLFNT